MKIDHYRDRNRDRKIAIMGQTQGSAPTEFILVSRPLADDEIQFNFHIIDSHK